MDELELSGKRYISTRRAGRENGYHSDYIGQLIRGGKVVGQKVGRSWYVDEESLATYLGKPYTAPETIKVDAEPELTVAEPVVAPAAVEIHQEKVTQPVQPQSMPIVEAARTPVAIHIEQPKAQTVVSHSVPVHVAPTVEHKVEQKASPVGLRYVEDNEPLLPVVSNMPEEDYTRESLIPPMVPVKRSTKFKGIAIIAVAAVAVAVVGVSIAASIFLGVNVQVTNDNTATVFYSIKN